jgi:hypothetical protein
MFSKAAVRPTMGVVVTTEMAVMITKTRRETMLTFKSARMLESKDPCRGQLCGLEQLEAGFWEVIHDIHSKGGSRE